MDIYLNEESMCDKVSLSVKKSHKISIYSRKQTKSPKKYDITQQQLSKNSELGEFTLSKNNDSRGNRVNFSNNKANETPYQQTLQRSVSQYNNIEYTHAVNDKLAVGRQHSYSDKFSKQCIEKNQQIMIKKPNNLFYNYQNPQNISQMIDKQAESQVNNLSIVQGSFPTGNRNKNGKQSQYSIANANVNGNTNVNASVSGPGSINSQQDLMQNVMRLMHEQIQVAKENCQRRFQLILKGNVKVMKELEEKVRGNSVMLREKQREIQKLKELLKKGSKRVPTQGEVSMKTPLSPLGVPSAHSSPKPPQQQVDSLYYQKRIIDLSQRLRVLQTVISNSKQSPNLLDKKIEILQKGLLNYTFNKIKSLSSKMETFISKYTQRVSLISKQMEKLSSSIIQRQQQKTSPNQNQIKQLHNNIKQLHTQFQSFTSKEFIYENYNIQQLKLNLDAFKEQLKVYEGYKFENQKIISLLKEEAAKVFVNKVNGGGKVNLSHAHETMSKYTTSNNPNLSKISISQLSNTHEYSNLMEKLPANFQQHNGSSQMLIFMSFTDQASQSLTQQQQLQLAQQLQMQIQMKKLAQSKQLKQKQLQQNANKGQSGIGMSKFTRATDMKETASQLQGSLPSASKYYLPSTNTKTPSSLQSIITSQESSTGQRIRNLGELKMESSSQRLLPNNNQQHVNKASSNTLMNQKSPTKQQQKQQQRQNQNNHQNHIHNPNNHQQPNLQNNTSYWSVSQMQDFNLSMQRPNNHETSDWSDDEFFYPGMVEKQQQSKVNQYFWQQNSPLQGSSPAKSMEEEFFQFQKSPMRKKGNNTEQNFYQQERKQKGEAKGNENENVNEMKSATGRKNEHKAFMHNSSFDYEKFSDDEDDNQLTSSPSNSPISKATSSITNSPQMHHKLPPQNNIKPGAKSPLLQQQPPHLQQPQPLTPNEQKVLSQCRQLQSKQLPVKMIYDRKKAEGMVRMVEAGHPFNGRTFVLQRRQVEKLEKMGLIMVKTYV